MELIRRPLGLRGSVMSVVAAAAAAAIAARAGGSGNVEDTNPHARARHINFSPLFKPTLLGFTPQKRGPRPGDGLRTPHPIHKAHTLARSTGPGSINAKSEFWALMRAGEFAKARKYYDLDRDRAYGADAVKNAAASLRANGA